MGEAILLLVGLTSLAGVWLGVHRFGLPRSGLVAAAWATLEAIGLAVVFLAANLALAALAIALTRIVADRFVSVYSIDDLSLGAVSLLQGFVFRWWRGRGSLGRSESPVWRYRPRPGAKDVSG